MIRYFTFFTVCFIYGSLLSQKLVVRTDKDQYLIGEEIKIEYLVKAKVTDSIQEIETAEIEATLFPIGSRTNGQSIDLETLRDPFDTLYKDKASKYLRRILYVTVYDSGEVRLSHHEVKINDSIHTFSDIAFKVYLVEPIDSVDIYDIHEQFAELPNEPFSISKLLKDWWWIFALILLLVIFYFVSKKRKKVYTPPERRTSLKERTMRALDALEETRMWEKDKLKEHFVELSFILRSYLASRYGIQLLERTTTEARILLKEKGLNEDTITTIIRILSQSDLVKFAQSKPTAVDILKTVTLARQIVAETSPLEIEEIDD